MKTISRRSVLRGAGGIAVGLPALDIMNIRPARGAAPVGMGRNGFPKRLILLRSGSGFARQNFPAPGATETNFAFGPALDPLAPIKQDVILVTRIDNLCMEQMPRGRGVHPGGNGTIWTSRELLTGEMTNFGPCSSQKNPATDCWGYPDGPSVDQVIASQVSAGLPFKSLELGAYPGGYTQGSSLFIRNNFAGAGKPLPQEWDPSAAFNRVFKNLNVDNTSLQKLREQRKSILDRVMLRYTALGARLGAADHDRVDNHLAAIRDLEGRLSAKGTVTGERCTRPPVSQGIPYKENSSMPATLKAQIDILVMAMTCDLTRVASLMFAASHYPWAGVDEDHHDLSHKDDGDSEAKLGKIDRWHVENAFVYLVKSLKAVKEGAGTMFDNSVVMWMSEISDGSSHSGANHAILMAGPCDGAFRTGRWIDTGKIGSSVPHANLLVSLMNAMGLPDSTFGDPRYCTGALTQLG